eukprot:TRINITY_DN14839_c0_g1_i1.p1 TRINITY_DN14839_c0_g1~~TRINITY_DN14839_c0_g1_i1.p1  ORF type:complete len:314 (-),score=51.33 TRINITY_DN14839_c0_g1_i1:211-1074(-)
MNTPGSATFGPEGFTTSPQNFYVNGAVISMDHSVLFDMAGRGNPALSGPGAPTDSTSSAGHGARGAGVGGGAEYGSKEFPALPGSGGNTGQGGGVVTILACTSLTFNAYVNVAGLGDGSGGSVLIFAPNMTYNAGQASIDASSKGTGAGGRIAIITPVDISTLQYSVQDHGPAGTFYQDATIVTKTFRYGCGDLMTTTATATTSALNSQTTSAVNSVTTSSYFAITTSAFDSATTSAFHSATTSTLDSATTSALNYVTSSMVNMGITISQNAYTNIGLFCFLVVILF